jgi:hypothetical protein
MAPSKLEKYIKRNVENTYLSQKAPNPGVPYPTLELTSDKDFGNQNFRIFWTAVAKPTKMPLDSNIPHKHEQSQFLLFVGGDLTNMVDLGGEVELTMGEDLEHVEKLTFTKATWVFIPGGMYHTPLVFKKINDPKKPILFHDFYLGPSSGYKKIWDKPSNK